MTAAQLLDHLANREVEIRVVDGNIELDAPPGVLTPTVLAEIRQHKLAIVERLTRPRDVGLTWPPPPDPDMAAELHALLIDGTLARVHRGRTFRFSTGQWCVNLPELVRRLLARIDTDDEGPHTRDRLELVYWQVRHWLDEERES